MIINVKPILNVYSISNYLTSNLRNKYILFCFLALFFSFIELFSILSVFGLLAVLVDPAKFLTSVQIFPLFKKLHFKDLSEFKLITTTFFCIFTICTSFSRVFLLKLSSKLVFQTGKEITACIFSNILNMPYLKHLETNSSDISDLILFKVDSIIYNTILPFVTLITATCTLFTLLCFFAIINFKMTLFVLVLFSLFYYLILFITKEKIFQKSKLIANESSKISRIINESFGSIRDIIINDNRKFVAARFASTVNDLRVAQANINVISQSPKYILECFGMVSIAIFAFTVIEKTGATVSVPLLGFLAMLSQRILPLCQSVYWAITNIKSNNNTLLDILKILNTSNVSDIKTSKTFRFDRSIKCSNLSFYYKKNKIILDRINFVIKKGQFVGIYGKSGSGKSTFLDLLMGLFKPRHGSIVLDDNQKSAPNMMRSLVAHVPQEVYLIDDTILNNIVFSSDPENIDYGYINKILKWLEMLDFINDLPLKLETIVGEKGTFLSGGQKQRIGIARALYKRKPILVLDEATSALDPHTEKSVVNAIANIEHKPTIIMVTHKKSLLKYCDLKIEIKDKKIFQSQN